jgi:hypothetical protein
MITKALKDILVRIEAWPETAQDEAVATLQALEEELLTPYALTDDDRRALERSAEDMRQGRFATDEAVREVFDHFHRA